MPSITNYFIFSSLALSALTLATPLGLRIVGQRDTAPERLFARVPEPAPIVAPVLAARTIRRRDNSDCKAAEATPSSTPTSSSKHNPSKASSSSGGTHTGEGTYYETGLGACGETSSDSQHIVAVSKLLFDSYPGYDGANSNDNPICGKKVTAHYKGKSVTCTIVDRCVGCAHDDLDFSPSAFSELANQGVGRLYGVTWDYA